MKFKKGDRLIYRTQKDHYYTCDGYDENGRVLLAEFSEVYTNNTGKSGRYSWHEDTFIQATPLHDVLD